MLDLFRLDGKTAIVTGGGRGLGEYMALALAEAGANVVTCSRKRDACEDVATRIRFAGARALPLECDVTRAEDVSRAIAAAVEEFGSVDILVNNGGATWGAPAIEMPIEKFDQVLATNVRGTFAMSQEAARVMIDRGNGGSIINIASVAALKGGRPGVMETVGYNASKGAVISMTRDLATSWAGFNIRVNAIAPGWFPTRMSRGVIEKSGDRLLASIPLGRFGEPTDIQGAVVFLASRAAAYITGQTLVIDGGQTAW